jgi:drug/metabolite transporter (DMT)-like permease
MTRLDRFLPLILFSVPLTWAGSFIAGKVLVAEIDPLSSVFWRFALSAAVMLPALALWHRGAHPKLSDPGFLRHLAIVVVLSGVVYHVLFFWGLTHASPTNAALVITLNPFFTTLGEALILKKPRTPRFYVGFAMAFSGAAWVILGRGGGLAIPGFGELICLAASISWSAYTLAANATNDGRWDALWVNGYSYILTSIAVLPFVWAALHHQLAGGISTAAWLGSWYMAIFPTAIGYTVYYIGVQRRGPAWTASYIYLIPPLAAGLDLAFFGAPITFALVVGTALVVSGLAVGLRGNSKFQIAD